jgi:hypothetical protein
VTPTTGQSGDPRTLAATARVAGRLGLFEVAGAEILLYPGRIHISVEANAAQVLAAILNLRPVTRPESPPTEHRWHGEAHGVDLYVRGAGFLADQVPDALVADVLDLDAAALDRLYAEVAAAPPPTYGYRHHSTESREDITPDDTAGL